MAVRVGPRRELAGADERLRVVGPELLGVAAAEGPRGLPAPIELVHLVGRGVAQIEASAAVDLQVERLDAPGHGEDSLRRGLGNARDERRGADDPAAVVGLVQDVERASAGGEAQRTFQRQFRQDLAVGAVVDRDLVDAVGVAFDVMGPLFRLADASALGDVDVRLAGQGDSPVFGPPLRVFARKSGLSPASRKQAMAFTQPSGR